MTRDDIVFAVGVAAAAIVAFAGGVIFAAMQKPASAVAAANHTTVCPVPSLTASADNPRDMVLIAGGTFTMGANTERPEERPAHQVTVSSFLIDRHEVTNAQFRAFVADTGYVTIAERGLGDAGRGKFPEHLLRPGSMVFSPPSERLEDLTDVTKWWSWVEGANWRRPTGPGSSIEGLDNHPVVQISVEDAYAYAKWAGGALPTEAQWEFAARGGLESARFSWGDTHDEADPKKANTWQGAFPHGDEAIDGAHGTAAVGCYAPNGYGLHDMAGNVWEYVQNWWVPGHAAGKVVDPLGPLPRDAAVYGSPLGPRVTVKGGSWLCSPLYCMRFRPSGRQPQELALGSNHIGFRIVRNVETR